MLRGHETLKVLKFHYLKRYVCSAIYAFQTIVFHVTKKIPKSCSAGRRLDARGIEGSLINIMRRRQFLNRMKDGRNPENIRLPACKCSKRVFQKSK